MNLSGAYRRVAAIAVLAVGAFALNAGAAAGQTVLKLGHCCTETSAHGVLATKWAEFTGAKSGGELKLNVFPQGQLGDEKALVEALRLGTVDASVITTDVLISDVPEFTVIGLPYAFTSYEDAHAFLKGKGGNVLLSKLDRIGIKGLGIADTGFRSMGNNVRPINSPEDLKGVKIRVIQAPLSVKTLEAMGANPVPMPWAEVIPALEQKIIDGVESGNAYYVGLKAHEHTKFFSFTNHRYSGTAVLVNLRRFNRLSPKQQEALKTAALEAIPFANEAIQKAEAEMRPAFEKSRTAVNQVEQKQFQERVRGIWTDFEKEVGPELMQLLKQHVAKQ
jgi:TRAP-type transport system periplasmic protein